MKENTTSNEECLLLLTGTIQPNTQETVKLIDGNERRKQYIDAIDLYLQKQILNCYLLRIPEMIFLIDFKDMNQE